MEDATPIAIRANFLVVTIRDYIDRTTLQPR